MAHHHLHRAPLVADRGIDPDDQPHRHGADAAADVPLHVFVQLGDGPPLGHPADLDEGHDLPPVDIEELEPGECEFGYTIPRKFVENKLSSLKDEIAELSFILNQVSEAVTGEKKEYEVKTDTNFDYDK